jgi:hypothetical protein
MSKLDTNLIQTEKGKHMELEEKLEVSAEEKEAVEDSNLENMVEVYLKIRNHLREAQAEFAKKEADIKEQMAVIEEHFLERCKEIGAKNIKTKHGTIIRTVKTTYSTDDWQSFYEYIDEHKLYEVLHQRIHQVNLRTWLEEHPTLVPKGLNVVNSFQISVRRTK